MSNIFNCEACGINITKYSCYTCGFHPNINVPINNKITDDRFIYLKHIILLAIENEQKFLGIDKEMDEIYTKNIKTLRITK